MTEQDKSQTGPEHGNQLPHPTAVTVTDLEVFEDGLCSITID